MVTSNQATQSDKRIIQISQLRPSKLPIPIYWNSNIFSSSKNGCLIIFTAAFDSSYPANFNIEDYYHNHNQETFAWFNFHRRIENNSMDPEITEVMQGLHKWKLEKNKAAFHYFFQRPFPKKQSYDYEKDNNELSYVEYDLDFAIAALKQTILDIKPQSVLFLSAQTLHLVLQNFGKKEILVETENFNLSNFNTITFDKFAKENNFNYDFIDSPLDWIRLQNFSEMSSKNFGILTPPTHIDLKLSDKKNSLHGQAKYKVLARTLEKLLSEKKDVNDIDYYERMRILAVALEFQHEQKYSEYSRKVKYDAISESSKEKRNAKLQKGRSVPKNIL